MTARAPGWFLGPWLDLFLVVNIAWPLLVLLQSGDGFDGKAGVQFWQLYYITTPHRFITLLIVFLDRDRLAQRRGTFLLLIAIVLGVCLADRLATGTLACLLAIDYVWNAWHFAAQHHGVYRLYGRMGATPFEAGLTFEKWGLRFFLLYVILRVATATWADSAWDSTLQMADWIILPLPAWLVLRDLLRSPRKSPGRFLYLLSVTGLYMFLLWAVHDHRPGLVLALATASALFHALEYLSLVTWSVKQRHASLGDRMGLMAYLVPRWGIVLAVFVVVLGAGGWLMDRHYLELWLTLNVAVAFLHYAYDGLIWRRRAA